MVYQKVYVKTELENPKFPAVTSRFREIKTTEGGLNAMCEVMEQYIQKDHIEKIQRMLSKGYTKEQILDIGYTEAEYEEAEKELLVRA